MALKKFQCFLICITLSIIGLFLISIIKVEELGVGFIGIIIFVVFPLLGLAWVITISSDRERG
ncbi:transmembrane protein, putative [Medicago truncatula]|uniref:Transmembrane protein, putative n=1 Tax=Medicago truncatula TaxID=3880 RepID=G7IKL9_MEDTR|nr:transmembrane protein, putative [Medicago truncatula]